MREYFAKFKTREIIQETKLQINSDPHKKKWEVESTAAARRKSPHTPSPRRRSIQWCRRQHPRGLRPSSPRLPPSPRSPAVARAGAGAVRCELAASAPSSAAGSLAPRWAQRTVVIPPQRRGCHLITPKVPPPLHPCVPHPQVLGSTMVWLRRLVLIAILLLFLGCCRLWTG